MEKYDAIIIGFGKGGKTLAGALGKAGKKTALIEKNPKMYGGTCPNVGCIPTKFLVQKASQIKGKELSYEERNAVYQKTMEEKDQLTAKLRNKMYHMLEDHPMIDVIDGTASFLSDHVVAITSVEGTKEIYGEQIFIDTGASPFIPPIQGIEGNEHVYVSETLLEKKELPRHLIIIGGGYIGVEFSSIYRNFGSQVTILQDGEIFLPREDEEIAKAVKESLEGRGVRIVTKVEVKKVEQRDSVTCVTVLRDGKEEVLEGDAVLIATGRRPNVKELQVEKAGITLTNRGAIKTDETLRTSVPHIFALGDVRGGLQFTYISLDDYRIVASQVLGDGSYTDKKRGAIPYSVFLTPAFSRVGLSEKEAKDKGYEVLVHSMPAINVPKSKIFEQPDGLLKVVVDAKTEKILGAHLFCEDSFEIINIVKLAMDGELPYTVLKNMIFTHPSMAEALNDVFQLG